MSLPLANTKVHIAGLLGLLLLAGLLCAPSALAGFEQVAPPPPPFDNPPPENPVEEPNNRTGAAVNVSGAGGAKAGTVFVSAVSGQFGLDRYNVKGEFEVHLSEASFKDVVVSPSTGCVYGIRSEFAEKPAVTVLSPDGSTEIANFAEVATSGETISNSPEKLHQLPAAGGIAVDDTGVVYLSDHRGGESRVMVFKPESPGDCEHYSYAGQEDDFATGQEAGQLAVDDAGHLYAVEHYSKIVEFATAKSSAPVCEFDHKAPDIYGFTVDSVTAQVFYTYTADKTKGIRVLEPCDGGGKFIEDQPVVTSPKPANVLRILAINPAMVWGPGRPAGVMYGVSSDLAAATEPSYIFASAVSHEPVVESESVANVTATTATLKAEINPNGATTSYIFEYLTAAAYEANEETTPGEPFIGATEVPLGVALLGTGQAVLPAAVSVSALAPETDYRYRVIATNADGSVPGNAKVFRTFPLESPGLRDHRAYELVSPAHKNGGEVFPINPSVSSCGLECKPGTGIKVGRFPVQSSPDGEAVAYMGFPFSSAEGSSNIDEYVSRRTSTGWQTINPTPTFLATVGEGGYKAFDSNLATALLYQNLEPSLSSEAPVGYADLYLQAGANPTSLPPLLREAPPNRPEGFGDEATNFHLNYAAATPDLSHVLVAANDALTSPTAFAPEALDGGSTKDNLYDWVGGQPRLVNVLPGNAETVPGATVGRDYSHAISDDGSRIFWSSETGQVYVRINGEETLEVKDHTGKFLTASADGSKVLLSDGCLYAVDVEACDDLTQGEGGLKGVAGQSEDLASIYFIDSAALTPESESNPNGEYAKAGESNLYSWQGGGLGFIATLTPEEEDKGDWAAAPLNRTAEASPSGRFLTFLSKARLTGYTNTGPTTGICRIDSGHPPQGPCREAFLFDSKSGRLSCPSCNPSGELPLGPARLPLIGGASSSLPQPTYLTDEGRLYFETQDSLVPTDTNDGVEDVYQYEPQGAGVQGTCERPEGCVSLISAGTEPVDSNFLAIDKTGKNIFFTTRDQLALRDTDDALDLYDAREGGGIPAETEVGRGECQGEACQPQESPPNDPTPGSSSFQGAGNVNEPQVKPCPKGKVRKHGKCVKKHSKKHHKKAHGRAANSNRRAAR